MNFFLNKGKKKSKFIGKTMLGSSYLESLGGSKVTNNSNYTSS